MVAAIYLDGGYKKVFKVIKQHFARFLTAATEGNLFNRLHPKSQLQEITQTIYKAPPRYIIVKFGPDHKKTFSVNVTVGNKVLGSGSGSSKKNAEQKAAQEALTSWNVPTNIKYEP